MKSEVKILIVDDDIDFSNFINDVAKTLKLNCTVANNSEDFIKFYDPSVTLIFMDLNIPNMDGIELLRLVESQKTTADIILMSGEDKRVLETAKEFAISIGLSVVASFSKPVRLAELENILKNCTAPKPPKKDKEVVAPPRKLDITEELLIIAIQNKEFLVYYQPKVEIQTQKLIGVEALVRWQHPHYGLIFPDQFIPQSESFNLIDELTWIVIKKAVTQIESLKTRIGFSLMVSFNLSPYSLHDLSYPDKLLEIITEANMKPENIILEVTETGLLKELSSALDIFTRLRLKNIHLSIDDFGTGYAMMQQLKLIPATEIKIDKSFVKTMLESDESKITVKKIIEMGHELGMTVVAEGVETKEQLQALHELQCDIAQGYFYSKPIPIDELISWINNKFSKS